MSRRRVQCSAADHAALREDDALWDALPAPPAGDRYEDDEAILYMKNCDVCGSTISREVLKNPEAAGCLVGKLASDAIVVSYIDAFGGGSIPCVVQVVYRDEPDDDGNDVELWVIDAKKALKLLKRAARRNSDVAWLVDDFTSSFADQL